MKITALISFWSAGVAAAISVQAQGTFENLDFESAYLPTIPAGQSGGLVSISDALPDWSAAVGSTAVTQILYNSITVGSPSIDIFGPNWDLPPGIIGGSYSVALQWGEGPGLVEESASLWQDGTIPANAESLEFKAWTFLGTTPLTVSFAGDNLPLFVLSSGVSHSANIASFANQTGQLEFTAPVGSVAGVGGIELDDISFSTSVVPEPGPVTLTAIGGLLFALYRRFAFTRQ
jgi:hypothetical protein